MGLQPLVPDNTGRSVRDFHAIDLDKTSYFRLVNKFPRQPSYGVCGNRTYLGSPVRLILFEVFFDEGENGLAFDSVNRILPLNRRMGQGRVIIRLNFTVGFIKEERFSCLFIPHIKTVGTEEVGTVRLVPDIFLVVDPDLIDHEIGYGQERRLCPLPVRSVSILLPWTRP